MEDNHTAPLGLSLSRPIIEGMKANKQCTCNRRFPTSMKVQIGINLTDNNKIEITIIMQKKINKNTEKNINYRTANPAPIH